MNFGRGISDAALAIHKVAGLHDGRTAAALLRAVLVPSRMVPMVRMPMLVAVATITSS